MSVTIKADFHGEMRRFVLPKDTTMDTFVAKMREFFPSLGENEFNVYYRDQDGDVVRIGSTEELQHAFEIGGDVLRLAIQCQRPEPAGLVQPTVPPSEPRTLLDIFNPGRLFSADPFNIFEDEPFYGGNNWLLPWENIHMPWEHRLLKLRQKEEQLKHQREYEKRMQEAYKERQKQLSQQIRQDAEKFREEMDKRMAAAEKDDESGVKRSKSGTVVVARPKMRTFGDWDPVTKTGPGWSSTQWGPVGYELHYYYPGEEEEKQDKEETKEETKEDTKEEMETK